MPYIDDRKYNFSRRCKLVPVSEHPLLVSGSDQETVDGSEESMQAQKPRQNSIESKLVTTSWSGLDPLSAALSSEDYVDDDLVPKSGKESQGFIGDDFVQWRVYRTKILNKFGTNEKLSIRSTFMFDKGTLVASNVSQKVKNRLEQLEDLEDSQVNEMSDLSQQDYIKRIGEMNQALNQAWENDQRVKALKIAIQCAKQLSSTNVIHFYPSKFVLITDILDEFGELVYKRIENKTNVYTENANETCRNWFYKISSIRELLPRFYIECSVLKTYRFLFESPNTKSNFEKIFLRLTKMIRGLGDPLVAIYCRVYLCRVVINLYPDEKKIFLSNIYDIIDNINQMTCQWVKQNLAGQRVDYPTYYTLFQPPLDWILNCLFYKAHNPYHENVLKYFRNKIESIERPCCSPFVLSSMFTSFTPGFVAQNLMSLIKLIRDIYKNEGPYAYPKYILIKNIGDALVHEDDFFEKYSLDKNVVFEEFWNLTQNLRLKHEYVSCLETWSEIIAKFSDVNDINKFLGDLIANISIGRDYENFSSQLLQILSRIIENGSKRIDCETFFAMSNLLPFLDLFHKEETKVEACKMIVAASNKNCPTVSSDYWDQGVSDPVILNSITYLCKSIHNSINALTLEDEKRQISALIIGFIRRVSFKRDFEARLNFYIESRANFFNLDLVLNFLVHQTNLLAMETHKLVNGHHTRKTISFVNACIAFSYITIPSISDIILRLQLYISSSHVSLVNGCLPQTDSFLKLTITLIRQLPSYSESSDGKLYSNDEFLYGYSSQLLSTLIVVPDNPELGILYLFKGLYNVLKEFKFETNSPYRLLIWLNLVRYLSTCMLDNYPYHVDKVDSNDTLYAQDEEFIQEIQTYFDIIFQEMLDIFKKSQHEIDIKQQCNISLEIINLILSSGNIDKLSHIVNQLWNWVYKTQVKNNFPSLNYKMKQIYDHLGKTIS